MSRELNNLLKNMTPSDSKALRDNFRVKIEHAQSMAGIPQHIIAASNAPKATKKAKRAAVKLAKIKQPRPKKFAAFLSVLGVLAVVIPLGVIEFFASKAEIEQRVIDKNTEKVIHAIKAQAAKGETTIEVVLP